MPIIKHIQNENYTIVDNECLRDPDLDLDCRGLLVTMLSLPDDWNFSGRGLSRILPCGKDKTFRLLNKLETCGYLKREEIRDEKGRIRDTVYYIAPTPIFKDNSLDSDMEISEAQTTAEAELNSISEQGITVSAENSRRKCGNLGNDSRGKCDKMSPKSVEKCANDFEKQNCENICCLPCTTEQDTVAPDTELSDSNKLNNNKINTNKLNIYNTLSTNRNICGLEDMKKYEAIIKSNIGFDSLEISLSESDFKIAEEILHLVTEIVALNTQPLKINGNLVSAEIVKSRFLQLDHWDINFVIEYLRDQCNDIRNIRGYLISMLFNAPQSKNNYYRARVNYDLYGNNEGG